MNDTVHIKKHDHKI